MVGGYSPALVLLVVILVTGAVHFDDKMAVPGVQALLDAQSSQFYPRGLSVQLGQYPYPVPRVLNYGLRVVF